MKKKHNTNKNKRHNNNKKTNAMHTLKHKINNNKHTATTATTKATGKSRSIKQEPSATTCLIKGTASLEKNIFTSKQKGTHCIKSLPPNTTCPSICISINHAKHKRKHKNHHNQPEYALISSAAWMRWVFPADRMGRMSSSRIVWEVLMRVGDRTGLPSWTAGSVLETRSKNRRLQSPRDPSTFSEGTWTLKTYIRVSPITF